MGGGYGDSQGYPFNFWYVFFLLHHLQRVCIVRRMTRERNLMIDSAATAVSTTDSRGVCYFMGTKEAREDEQH